MAPPSVPPVADPPTLAALEELTRTVRSLAEIIAQRESASPARRLHRRTLLLVQQGPVQAENHTARTLRDFLRLDTPSFYGEPNPDVAERWLDQVTRNLDTSGIVDEHTRVSFAAHQLKDNAYHWWRRVQDRVGDDYRAFETVFLEQYFPDSAREERQQQFLELRQEGMSVAEYESTFTALSRFSPEMVVTDAHRCRRFERGLRAQILDRVLTLRIRVYSELVDTVMAVERGLSEAARVRESRQRPSSVVGVVPF